MKSFYKIISYLLLPPAVVYSMMVLILIAAALANPTMLLPIFMLVGVAIYTFISFYFLVKGIDGRHKLTRSVKDWIKVNAVVTVVFALLIIGQTFFYFTRPEMMHQVADQAMKQQQGGITFTKTELEKYMNIMLYVFLVHSILLLIHIPLTLRLVKANAYLFEEPKF